MKFNEKLIELRKKEGLSQEELGYKLNVTRQTVSKWELGQTTPEMEKIIELGKIFNISVDDLINESEVQDDSDPIMEEQPMMNRKNKEKNIRIIIIGVISIIIVLIVVKFLTVSSIFNKVTDTSDVNKNIFDKIFGIFDKVMNIADQEIEEQLNEKTDIKSNIESSEQSGEKSNIQENFSNIFDKANDIIGESNKEHNEIDNQISIGSFNGAIEIFNGTQMGGGVTSVLDKVITSNKTKERKITVKYMGTETQDENEIKNIKRNIGTFDNYEVTFEYDVEGFINKVIIEKI